MADSPSPTGLVDMAIHLGFAPDADRARHLDRQMHAELASSLRHVCDASRDAVAFDAAGMDRLIQSLERGDRYAPLVFSDYYALVIALRRDDHAAAARLFARLSQAQPVADGQTVEALKDPRRCDKSADYQRMLTEDAGIDIAVHPPTDDVADDFEARYRRGMAIMERTIPELAGEVRAIVREVVCVVGDPTKKMQFDGGSHFQLWGALFLNADFHPTDQAIVEVVAHESAHSLLFGFCTQEPLVYNSDDELYTSPLRQDPRPMDGIYHATFVSARMHWATSRLLEADALPDASREQTLAAIESDRQNFEAGYRVVAEHGRLSATGAGLMAAARGYMDGVAS